MPTKINHFPVSIKANQETTEAEIQYEIGIHYLNGTGGFEKDAKKAFRHLRAAAEMEYAKAQLQLGLRYEHEFNLKHNPQDMRTAAKYYYLAADQSLPEAQAHLGACYELGKAIPINYKKAFYWYSEAAAQENTFALNTLGNWYSKGIYVQENQAMAIECYKVSARNGDRDANFILGIAYKNGTSIQQDGPKALEHFKLSAAQGHVEAEYWIGYCYESGFGVKEDQKQAVKHYHLAAEKGLADAQFALGSHYQLANNDEKAVHYYTLAAGQHHAAAQNNLAFFHEQGRGGLVKEIKKAVHHYQLAALRGSYIAKNNLGVCYQTGNGVEQNHQKAFQYYQSAIDTDGEMHPFTKIKLGLYYLNGIAGFLDKNPAMAAELFHQAKASDYNPLEDLPPEPHEMNTKIPVFRFFEPSEVSTIKQYFDPAFVIPTPKIEEIPPEEKSEAKYPALRIEITSHTGQTSTFDPRIFSQPRKSALEASPKREPERETPEPF